MLQEKSATKLRFLTRSRSLHEIMGAALESIYDSNISSSERLSLSELISTTLNLSMRLEQWRDNNFPAGLIGSNAALESWPANTFDHERHSILTSIIYYRTVLMVHGALLMRALDLAIQESDQIRSSLVQESIKSLLKVDFIAVKEFHHLIQGLLFYQKSFFRVNATWWVCNYAGRFSS